MSTEPRTVMAKAMPAVSGENSLTAWWTESDDRAHRAFIAASFGWMLDSFDVMLYSIVVAALIEDPSLRLSLQTAGVLNSITLIAGAAGGIAFGVIADRIGPKRALMAAVLIYSIFSAACGPGPAGVSPSGFPGFPRPRPGRALA